MFRSGVLHDIAMPRSPSSSPPSSTIPPAAAQTLAQTWPTRPVTMVVGFAAGGGTDVLGRIIGRRLSETLGAQVIIENVGGAGGMVGSARVVKAAPDGYTFVLGSRADAINQTLYKKPLYNLRTDLTPVVLVADQPMVMVARKDLPVDSLPAFIAYAKANQDKMQFGSAGAGSTGHLDCALFNAAIGVNITHIPYKGGGPAMQDLIGGRIDYFCTLTGTAVPHIEGGSVKAIGVFTRERAPMLPKVPSRSSRASMHLRPRPGSRSSCRPARRRRWCRGCAKPPSRRWTRRRCRRSCSPPAPSWRRRSAAARRISSATSRPRSRRTPRR